MGYHCEPENERTIPPLALLRNLVLALLLGAAAPVMAQIIGPVRPIDVFTRQLAEIGKDAATLKTSKRDFDESMKEARCAFQANPQDRQAQVTEVIRSRASST